MSDQSQGDGWWLASDGRWYPPAATPDAVPPTDAAPPAVTAPPESPVSSGTTSTPTPMPDAVAPDLVAPDLVAPDAIPPEPVSSDPAAPGPGWWLASDGQWYPPQAPADVAPTPAPTSIPSSPSAATAPVVDAAAGTTAGGSPAAPPPAPPAAGKAKPKRNLVKPLVIVGSVIVVVFVLVAAVVVVQRFRGRLPDNAIPIGVDEPPSSDITLADDAVVVRSDNGNAVKELSPDGTRIVLDPGAAGADQIQPGKAMILTGVTAVKVDSVERNGDQLVVTAKPAAITDLIKDGTIHFDDTKADLSKATLRVFAPTPDLVTQEGAMGAPGASAGPMNDSVIRQDSAASPFGQSHADAASPLSGPELQRLFHGAGAGEGEHAAAFVDLELAQAGGGNVSREGDLGGYHYEFNATVSGESINFTLHLTTDQHGFRIDINVSAQVSGIGFGGDMEISAATVRQFRLDAPNLAGRATITGSAAAGPQATRIPITALQVPMSVQIPFPVYGIPFTVGIDAEAKVELMFTSRDASVSGSFDAHFDGHGGMGVNNGSLTATGAFNQDWEDPLAAVEGTSITATSMIVTIQFPKVSLGVGIALARASAYLEADYIFAPTVSGATNFTPCRAEPVSLTIKAGVAAEFLGHEFGSHEVQIAQKSIAPYDPPVAVCRI